jgi:hypothetical protein
MYKAIKENNMGIFFNRDQNLGGLHPNSDISLQNYNIFI